MKKAIALLLAATIIAAPCAAGVARAAGAAGAAGVAVAAAAAPYADAIGGFRGAAIAAYSPGMFNDIDEGQWYGANNSAVVKAAYELQIMSGKGAGVFDPEGPITRAEAVKMAAVVHEIYNGGDASVFGQGAQSPWYQEYVDYATSRGLIGDAPFDEQPGEFDAPATRAEMAYIFARAVPDGELRQINTVNYLPDVPLQDRTSMRSFGAEIYKLYRAGVLSGNDSRGTFRPYSDITRAEAAAIICRIVLPSERVALDLSRVAISGGYFLFDPASDAPPADAPPPRIEDCEAFYETDSEYAQLIYIRTNIGVSDFKYIDITLDDPSIDPFDYYPSRMLREIYAMGELAPERPFAVAWVDVGLMPTRGFSFVDDKGATRYFSISSSGYDGSLLLIEFNVK